MSRITQDTFVRAVAQYFEPIVKEHGWVMDHRSPSLYEILTKRFVMRIRFDVGAHNKSLNATLIPSELMPGDVENGGHGELGVAVIAGYNGVPIKYMPREATEEGFFEQSQDVANMVRKHALPYLLGQKTDWDKIVIYLQKLKDESTEQIKDYKFSPQVQKRWHLPPKEFPDNHLPAKPNVGAETSSVKPMRWWNFFRKSKRK